MFDGFTDRAKRVMRYANQESQRLQHNFITPEHVLWGMLNAECRALEIMRERHLNPDTLKRGLQSLLQNGTDLRTFSEKSVAKLAKDIIAMATEESRSKHRNYVGTEHLLLAILRLDNSYAQLILSSCRLIHAQIVDLIACYSGPEAPLQNEPVEELLGKGVYVLRIAPDADPADVEPQKKMLERLQSLSATLNMTSIQVMGIEKQ